MEPPRLSDCFTNNRDSHLDAGDLRGMSTASSISESYSTPETSTTGESGTDAVTLFNICYVGAGYVGATNAAVTALANPSIQVSVVDIDQDRIARWNSKHLPIDESGLDMVVRVARDGLLEKMAGEISRTPNLEFSTHLAQHLGEADMIFIAVTTQTKTVGQGAGSAIDIGHLKSAVETIAAHAKPGAIIVEKSTVPCETARMIKEVVRTVELNLTSMTEINRFAQLQCYRPGVSFEVLSNPEFLTEGTAIMDMLRPSRILIGSETTTTGLAAAEALAALHHWVPPEKILRVTQWSSELAKLVSNAFLAQRISSINTISAIAESIGADIAQVSQAVGLDPRIGRHYLQAGIGFGGSCLKKDTLGLAYLAEALHLPQVASYWRAVVDVNEWQVDRFVRKILECFHGTIRSKKIAILGYNFKENTSDARESQSIPVIDRLLQERPANITIYDPGCDSHALNAQLLHTFGDIASSPKAALDPYQACEGASAVLILTPWAAFTYPPSPPIESAPPTLENENVLITHPDGYIKVTLPGCTDSQTGYLRPVPACHSNCESCNGLRSRKSSSQPVEWDRIVERMEEPKWVFDARQQVEPELLAQLGCRVFSLGRSAR